MKEKSAELPGQSFRSAHLLSPELASRYFKSVNNWKEVNEGEGTMAVDRQRRMAAGGPDLVHVHMCSVFTG